MDNKQLELNFELEMKNDCINALEDCILKQFEAMELLKKQNNNLKHAFDNLESDRNQLVVDNHHLANKIEWLKRECLKLENDNQNIHLVYGSNFGGIDDVKW